jgi:hypothetical protein
MNHDAPTIQQKGRAVEVREETQGGAKQSREGAGRFSEAAQELFWKKVNKSGPIPDPAIYGNIGNCWLWTGCIATGGYGKFWHGGKRKNGGKHYPTHRLSLFFLNGKLNPELFVLHSCDNPPCCNPLHLREGTKKQNYADAKSKGRNTCGAKSRLRKNPWLVRGEENNNSKLITTDVLEIIKLGDASKGKPLMSQRKIAKLFKITQSHVGRIIRRESWKYSI